MELIWVGLIYGVLLVWAVLAGAFDLGEED